MMKRSAKMYAGMNGGNVRFTEENTIYLNDLIVRKRSAVSIYEGMKLNYRKTMFRVQPLSCCWGDKAG